MTHGVDAGDRVGACAGAVGAGAGVSRAVDINYKRRQPFFFFFA